MVFSLLFIVISCAALAVGIVSGDDMLVIGSIVLSLVAAAVLFIGVWRQRDADSELFDEQSSDDDGLSPEPAPVREEVLPSKEGARSQPPRSTPGRAFPRVPDEDTLAGEPAGLSSRQESTPVSTKEHVAWARSAVTAIAEGNSADDASAIMQDRRARPVDVATEIPQLMPAAAAVRKQPAYTGSPPVNEPKASIPPHTESQSASADQTTAAPTAPAAEIAPAPSAVSAAAPVAAKAVVPPAPPQPSEPLSSAIARLGTPDNHVTDRDGARVADNAATVVESPTAVAAAAQPIEPLEQRVAPDVVEEIDDVYPDPPDEPPAELLLSYEERQLADCDVEVLVVDGRPRFHLAGCLHLTDKTGEPLVLAEAAELGFTSCSLCAAATTVLAARS
ncbi:MAG: hypothetical protein ACRDPW_11200 [Mycobacteriales bacterium]